MLTLKVMINRYMHRIAAVILAATLAITAAIELSNEQTHARADAERIFDQIEQILEENQSDLAEVEESYVETCLASAEAIAYIIELRPSVLDDIQEMRKVAELIEVDEIHIFDLSGTIITGTHPEYYGFTFDSGEQIGFFKPMLEDKSLRLCQEITPNTAENKLMQYSAVWSENGEFIVQIGMEPVNRMKLTEKNELSHIFSLFKVNVGSSFYAIDIQSGEIIGSTVSQDVGKHMTQAGFDPDKIANNADGFHATINGSASFCVFRRMGSNYVGRIVTSDVLYQRVPASVAELALCLVLIAIVLVWAVTRYMNRHVVEQIYGVNKKLSTITKGDLDQTVDANSCREFSELSSHINELVSTLMDNNKKMSYVLSKTDMFIGVYEYNTHVNEVRFTEYIPRIFALDDEQAKKLSSNYRLFKEFIERIYDDPVPGENGIFRLGEDGERYVLIEELVENDDVFGVAVDMTEEISKLRRAEVERDIDKLTGLYNRRGFEAKLTDLLGHPQELYRSALIMIDADGLKEINDKYGHEKGDVYLQKIAGVINNFGLKSTVAARYGGDEFVLFLYDYDDDDELLNTIRTLEYIQTHSSARLGPDLSVPLRFSFGYAMTDGEEDLQKLLKLADERMYENKRERKGSAR